MAWYGNLYRRYLCDMHINDWDDSFLSQFSPEEYVKNLKLARINYAMLYFQSHVGLCYYPTKVGSMHRALAGREHIMRDTVDLCHQNGIKVIGYYSINYNTVEHDNHPDWRMRMANGKSRREGGASDINGQVTPNSFLQARYGLCCPNNRGYRQFVYDQIAEMVEYFDCDALFFDMHFWPHTCYCASCKARWAKEQGGKMPVQPELGSKEHLRLMEAKYAWMGEWAQAIRERVRQLRPNMPVEFNYASGIAGDSDNGCGDEVAQASDYAGGDLYGGMLEHSFTCKFYLNATRNQPFEYMFSRCKPGLKMHTLTKTLDEMKTAVALTAAHHGATLVIDAIDPVGTMDERVYRRIGDMFDFEIPYEPYFKGRLIQDMAIYYGIRSKFVTQEEPYSSKTCAVGAADALIRAHIPFGVTGSYHDLSGKLLIAPALSEMEAADHDRLVDYVEKGGVLYLSGGKDRTLVERLTGGRIRDYTHVRQVYLAPKERTQAIFGWFNEKYPLPFEGNAPILEGMDMPDVAATLALPYTRVDETRFASIHCDPPGVKTSYPGIVIKTVGKGKVIWSAVPLEGVAMEEYRQIFTGLLMLGWDGSEFSFQTDAPENVECTLFQDENKIYVSAIALSSEAIALPAFTMRVKAEKAPKRVTLLKENQPVSHSYENGWIIVSARPLHIFDMYEIEM